MATLKKIAALVGVHTPAKLPCSKCGTVGRVEVRTAVMGKGWKVAGRKCTYCKGAGYLPTR